MIVGGLGPSPELKSWGAVQAEQNKSGHLAWAAFSAPTSARASARSSGAGDFGVVAAVLSGRFREREKFLLPATAAATADAETQNDEIGSRNDQVRSPGFWRRLPGGGFADTAAGEDSARAWFVMPSGYCRDRKKICVGRNKARHPNENSPKTTPITSLTIHRIFGRAEQSPWGWTFAENQNPISESVVRPFPPRTPYCISSPRL